jgi:hypothetical protein
MLEADALRPPQVPKICHPRFRGNDGGTVPPHSHHQVHVCTRQLSSQLREDIDVRRWFSAWPIDMQTQRLWRRAGEEEGSRATISWGLEVLMT